MTLDVNLYAGIDALIKHRGTAMQSVNHRSTCLSRRLAHIYPSYSQGYPEILEKCLLNSNYTMSVIVPGSTAQQKSADYELKNLYF